jgi:hypothetical protein
VGKGVEAAAASEGNDEADGVGWDGCRAWDLGCACVEFVFSFHFFFFLHDFVCVSFFFSKIYIHTHVVYTRMYFFSPFFSFIIPNIYTHACVHIYISVHIYSE